MAQAFEGIRVVDFTQVVAGPFATLQLAALGADVIKVEHPRTGDQSRLLLGQRRFEGTGTSPVYLGMNAGKRSFGLDLKHPAAKAIALALTDTADVVIQNFRAGVMDRLGFGYETLRARNPRLVYCAISGYGQSGPQRGGAAYDPAVQALSGMMSFTGHPETGPVRAGPAIVDLSTGLTAAYAISAALLRRERTGEGQFLDVAMLDTALTMMTPNIAACLLGGGVPRLNGNQSQTRLPTVDVFATRDGYLQMALLTDAHVHAFCEAIGREDLVVDPRFRTYAARVEHREAMREAIERTLAARSAREWLELLAPLNLPITPVLDLEESLALPQVAHRGVLQELPAPAGLDAPMKAVTAGFVSDADRPRLPRTAPGLGEHTDEILEELGLGGEIARLREAGAI